MKKYNSGSSLWCLGVVKTEHQDFWCIQVRGLVYKRCFVFLYYLTALRYLDHEHVKTVEREVHVSCSYWC